MVINCGLGLVTVKVNVETKYPQQEGHRMSLLVAGVLRMELFTSFYEIMKVDLYNYQLPNISLESAFRLCS